MNSSPGYQPLDSTINDLTLQLLRPAKFCSVDQKKLRWSRLWKHRPSLHAFSLSTRILWVYNLPPPVHASLIHFRSNDTLLTAQLCSLNRRKAFLSLPPVSLQKTITRRAIICLNNTIEPALVTHLKCDWNLLSLLGSVSHTYFYLGHFTQHCFDRKPGTETWWMNNINRTLLFFYKTLVLISRCKIPWTPTYHLSFC